MSGDFGELAIDLPGARPGPIGWEQTVYVFAVSTAYDMRQKVGQIGGRVDVVELARLDEARNRAQFSAPRSWLAHYIRDRFPPTVLVVTSGVLNPTKADLPAGSFFVPKPFDPSRVLGQIERRTG